jgi:putative ATP-binding cassette transporter
VLNRLAGFDASIDWAKSLDTAAPRVEHVVDGGTALTAEQLTVALPNGQEIVRVSDLVIEPAERVLVTGVSGSGKTSLFRALGGVWPFGSGRIRVPKGANLLVLPQNPYLPLGTLRGALAYPGPLDAFAPDEIDEVLTATGLEGLKERLEEVAYWADQLSVGEQQRLSIARALLQRPDWLFLDEATSALDEAAESMLYRLLLERLPQAAIVSIGHRSSLVVFHERFLELKPDGDGLSRLQPVRADDGERAELDLSPA